MRGLTTRRGFLRAAAAAAAGVAAARPVKTLANAEPGTVDANTRVRSSLRSPIKQTIVLGGPHIVTADSPYLNASGEIANKRFVLDPAQIGKMGFPTGTLGKPNGVPKPLTAFGLLTVPPNSKPIRIVDCDFEGPWKSREDIPELRPGYPKFLRGIDMRYASGIRIEGCSFDHLPAEAIYFYGCRDIEIEDIWSTSCTQLVRADWIGKDRSRSVRMNRLHHADGWGAADIVKNPGYASAYEKDRTVGANAVSGYFVDSEISNLTTSGEVKSALKLVLPIRVSLDRIYSSNFMIQGTMYWNRSDDPAKGNGKFGAYNRPDLDEKLGDHAEDVLITRSRFRPDQNAWLRNGVSNSVQLSYHQENIRFRDCVFYKPDQSTYAHQGIQVWDGVDVDVRDSVFVGWEAPGHPLPPFPKQSIVRVGNYGKPGSLPASINADFPLVNQFRV